MLLAVPIVCGTLTKVDLQVWEAALAFVLACLAITLRLLSIRRIGKNARVRNCNPHTLICTGPFAWTRNPLYLSNILIVTALAVVAGTEWTALALFIIGLLCYWPVILVEQIRLEEELGEDYLDYKKKVPALLPWRGPYQAPEGAFKEIVPWGEVLRREKALIPGIAVAYLVIVLARAEVLPVRQWLDSLGVDEQGLQLLVWTAAVVSAIVYSIGSERKRLRKAQRRQRQIEERERAKNADLESSRT